MIQENYISKILWFIMPILPLLMMLNSCQPQPNAPAYYQPQPQPHPHTQNINITVCVDKKDCHKKRKK